MDSTRVDVKDVETPGASVHRMPIIGEGAGVSLPGGIIILGRINEDNNTSFDKATLQHEYGHQLQLKAKGVIRYLKDVALPSIISASTSKSAQEHMEKDFERDASAKAAVFYGSDSEIAQDDYFPKYKNYYSEYVKAKIKEAEE